MFSHPRHSKWRGYVPNLQIKSQWQQNFFWINLWFANERQVHGEGESRRDRNFIFDLWKYSEFQIVSPLQSSGSYESLDERSLRGSSIPMMDTLSYSSCDRLLETGDPSDRINPQPCVPSVVTTCIRWCWPSEYLVYFNGIRAQVSGAAWFEHSWHLQSGLQQEESR